MTTMTLRTYVADKAAATKARRFLADRSILSKINTLRRGHHEFIMWVPTKLDEPAARRVLATAFGDVFYERPVYEADRSPAAKGIPAQPGSQQCPTCKATVLASSDNPEGYCSAHRPAVPKPRDETIRLDEMVQRVGAALDENLGMRFNVGGNGATITITDRWAESPDYTFTVAAVS